MGRSKEATAARAAKRGRTVFEQRKVDDLDSWDQLAAKKSKRGGSHHEPGKEPQSGTTAASSTAPRSTANSSTAPSSSAASSTWSNSGGAANRSARGGGISSRPRSSAPKVWKPQRPDKFHVPGTRREPQNWPKQAEEEKIARNIELRELLKSDPDSLSAEDRARAELLVERDARKAAKKIVMERKRAFAKAKRAGKGTK